MMQLGCDGGACIRLATVSFLFLKYDVFASGFPPQSLLVQGSFTLVYSANVFARVNTGTDKPSSRVIPQNVPVRLCRL